MKIYNKIVLSMPSGEVLFEDSFEYDGEIADCKGGGSTSTTTVDYEYNRRMADIAGRQQGIADEYFDYWRSYYKPYERAQIRANTALMPYETALAKEQLASQRSLLPGETALTREQIASERQLLPYQTGLTKEQIEAQRELLPGQTGLLREQTESQRELLPFQTDIAKDYYGMVLKGVNPADEMGKARSDVQQGFKLAEGERRREFSRMGIDPSSPAFASQRSADLREKAKAMAGAGTAARRYADDETFRRLREAM